ncbi:MAG: Co2+/Mg2+ efflux protein ApaG [Sphingomonadaceae bacterium]
MIQLFPYAATTRGITVRVAPSYLPEQSDPAAGRWVWAYHIRIENGGDEPVQLISRHWIITDAQGRTQEVRGLGVVGEQPVIQPGASFDYVSGCPLTTPSGMMRGSYQMTLGSGWPFEVEIPAFSLDSPEARARPN